MVKRARRSTAKQRGLPPKGSSARRAGSQLPPKLPPELPPNLPPRERREVVGIPVGSGKHRRRGRRGRNG